MSMLLPLTFSVSLIWDIEITRINLGLQVLRIASINSATDSIASSKDFFDGAFEFFGTALEAHLASDVNDGGLGQIARVLDVLGFLAVTQRLLQRLDHETCCIRLNVDLCCTILDGKFHSHTNAFSCACVLHNIITNLLG